MIPKFRVWVKIGKRMVFSDDILAIDYENKEIVTQQIYFENGLPDDRDIYCYNPDEIELMQSTGLKDKNGKEIFEGDVVRMRNPRDRRQIGMFQVVRVANSPMLGLLDQKLTTEIFNLYEHMRNYYEVKGNIYENPELLEVNE
ncbi:YopX protein [Streptococcus pneumoniae]|nr:YopX protein [Streptococcus pneumoniae]VPG90462.1 YopX protein [Streptococcus pneumoniae]